jgi:periplasmic protein CpxP/Spy
MKRTHTIIAGLAGGLSLAVFAAFAAGPGDGMGMHPGMGPGMGGMGMMHGAGPGMMAGQDLDQLKAQLAITPEQEAAWQAYAAKRGEQAALMQSQHAQRPQGTDATVSAPERMAQHLGVMSQHLAGMQGMSAALTDLYAVLSPEQRTVADQQLGPMGHRAQMAPRGGMGPMGRAGHGPCTKG